MPTYTLDATYDKSIQIEDYLGNSVNVEPGRSIQTYKILSAPFSKTSDSPYFPISLVVDNAFVVPGTKTGMLGCKIIRLTAPGSSVTVKWNSSSNPSSLLLPAGQSLDFENESEIESIVFEGSGTVKIEGF